LIRFERNQNIASSKAFDLLRLNMFSLYLNNSIRKVNNDFALDFLFGLYPGIVIDPGPLR